MKPELRLDALLAKLALGSRQDIKKMVRQGRVTVNGQAASSPDCKVSANDAVAVDRIPLDTRTDITIMLHKPAGFLTAARDKKQVTVMDLLPKRFETLGCMPIGRLDKDTTGLLLFTTDGELNHRLLSPKNAVQKIYIATVEGRLTESDVTAFAEGIPLSDFTCLPAALRIIRVDQTQSTAEVTVQEGKFHQIKRMFGALSHPVITLHRRQFAGITLPDDLKEGTWRYLTEEELASLYKG